VHARGRRDVVCRQGVGVDVRRDGDDVVRLGCRLLVGLGGDKVTIQDYRNFYCNKTKWGRREPPYIVFPEPASHGYAKCGFPPIRKLP
jgi:hypothetical protein